MANKHSPDHNFLGASGMRSEGQLRDDRCPKTDAPGDAGHSAPTENMSEYEAYVAKMAEIADGRTILNHSIEHAAIILAQLFKSANEQVQIVTGFLNPEAYGQERVKSAASEFLARNPTGRLDILCEEDVASDNPFLRAITSDPETADRVVVSKLDTREILPFHFAVVDGRHFRFEDSKGTHTAVVSFGDAKFGSKLSSIFESLCSDKHRHPARAA